MSSEISRGRRRNLHRRGSAIMTPIAPHVEAFLRETLSHVDARQSILSYRSWTLWVLGYPEAALTDADQTISDARGIG